MLQQHKFMRSILQPAFILHSRPFNETSVILDVFTLPSGRISLVAKGVRTARSRFRGLLRPFTPLVVSWSGKTELMSLSAAEAIGPPLHLMDRALLSGIYLNELLVRLLPRFDAYPAIFQAYQNTLIDLHNSPRQERSLRLFEKILLTELGYGFALDRETVNGLALQPEQFYEFVPGRGLVRSTRQDTTGNIFSGKCLLAFHQELLQETEDLRAAKRLNSIAIAALLGDKRLKSREVFR
jgi:DNA repair protein RecO (recombination protein O)